MLTILMLMLGLFLPFDPLMAQGCANPEAGFTATVDPNDNCQYTFMPQYTGTGIVLTHAWTFRNGTSLSFSSSDQPVPITNSAMAQLVLCNILSQYYSMVRQLPTPAPKH